MDFLSPESTRLPCPVRRNILKSAALIGCSLVGLSGRSFAAESEFWQQPRELRLYRPATGERVTATYWRDGTWDLDGYVRLCELLRDAREDAAVQMDRTLLDILFGIQKWAAHLGARDPLTITSGYRTRKTNNKLEGAAQNSMHLYGRAADIAVPGLSIKQLSEMGRHFKAGVGMYERSGFLHVDTGRERFWRR